MAAQPLVGGVVVLARVPEQADPERPEGQRCVDRDQAEHGLQPGDQRYRGDGDQVAGAGKLEGGDEIGDAAGDGARVPEAGQGGVEWPSAADRAGRSSRAARPRTASGVTAPGRGRARYGRRRSAARGRGPEECRSACLAALTLTAASAMPPGPPDLIGGMVGAR